MYKGIALGNIDTWSDPSKNKDGVIRSGQEVQGNPPSGDKTYVWGPYRCYVKTRDLGSWYKEVTVPPVEPPPATETISFTLDVEGFKPYTGELEKE